MTSLTADELWIIATACASAVACALLGCYLVLRRLSLLGDAISHAILPGLALAFIVTQSRSVGAMLVGAIAVGVLTALATAGLHRLGRVPEDAAMGVVFSSLFALGVLLITWVASSVDLDPGCVLYGLLEFVPFDTVRMPGFLGGLEIPRAFAWLAVVLATVVAAIVIFSKELRIVAFDPALATTLGISAALVHYSLLTLVAATTVVSFEAVGSILVVGMLVAPAATAHLLTDRLSRMMVIAALLAVGCGVFGYLGARHWNTSVAGMMTVVAGLEFLAAALFAPHHGVLVRKARQMSLSLRIRREDVLGELYRAGEHGAAGRAAPAMPNWSRRLALWSLRRRGDVSPGADRRAVLTAQGLARGRELVRSHRLWESFLARETPLAADHLHEPAHRAEHFVTREVAEKLAAEQADAHDPHGRAIP